MSCPNKGDSCFCTGTCKSGSTLSSDKALEQVVEVFGDLYVTGPLHFQKGLSGFHSGQKIFNLKSNIKHTCEFLCYDPSDEEFCYVRYATYNVQRVALENIQSK